MKEIVTTFYALGDAAPTLTIKHFPPFKIWEETRDRLASLFEEDAESFHTSETLWCDEEEYAEVVTMNGQVVGAFDRPLDQDEVAAIWGVNRMEKRAFINRIRSLSHIDGDMLPELTRQQQSTFLRDPMGYLLDADEAQSDAIMREIEARQGGNLAAVSFQPKAEISRGQSKVPKASRTKKQKTRLEGQREMLLPITGGAGEMEKVLPISVAGRKAV